MTAAPLDGFERGDEGLAQDLAAEHALPAILGRVPAEDVHLDGLEVEKRKQQGERVFCSAVRHVARNIRVARFAHGSLDSSPATVKAMLGHEIPLASTASPLENRLSNQDIRDIWETPSLNAPHTNVRLRASGARSNGCSRCCSRASSIIRFGKTPLSISMRWRFSRTTA